MTDKICVVTICRNEMDILPYTLPQSLKWADKVIVLDGGPEGTSTDGTWEYLLDSAEDVAVKNNVNWHINGNLNRLTMDDGKIYLETGTYDSDHTLQNNWDKLMRQHYLDILEEQGWNGWIFLIDSDETYTDDDWKKIKEYVKKANKNKHIMIRFPYIYFFKDLEHIITGPGWDTTCHHLSAYMPGCQYLDVSTLLRDMSGRCLTHYPKEMIMEVDDINLYHYSHAMDYEKERQRIFRYHKRGDLGPEVASKVPDKVEDWNWKDTRAEELKEDKIKPFIGEHPEHMKEYVKKYNAKNSVHYSVGDTYD